MKDNKPLLILPLVTNTRSPTQSRDFFVNGLMGSSFAFLWVLANVNGISFYSAACNYMSNITIFNLQVYCGVLWALLQSWSHKIREDLTCLGETQQH